MNSDQLKEVLELVHEIFPLPPPPFNGTHVLSLVREGPAKGMLSLVVWVQEISEIKYTEIIFNREPINRETLLQIKTAIEKKQVEITSSAQPTGRGN